MESSQGLLLYSAIYFVVNQRNIDADLQRTLIYYFQKDEQLYKAVDWPR